MASFGGPGRERQLALWKEGPQGTWVITLEIEISSPHPQAYEEWELEKHLLENQLSILKEESREQREETEQLKSNSPPYNQ